MRHTDFALVAGVQTCALPISCAQCRHRGLPQRRAASPQQSCRNSPGTPPWCHRLADRASNVELRRTCMDAIAELRCKPALIALAHKGVAYDEPAKKLFHSDGRKALKRLADALRLAEGSYDLRSNKGGIAVSGEVPLHGDEVYVQLTHGHLDRQSAGWGKSVSVR